MPVVSPTRNSRLNPKNEGIVSAKQSDRQESHGSFWPIQRFDPNLEISKKWSSWRQVVGSWGLFLLLLCPVTATADEAHWIFLPDSPLFQPVIGDPRERFTALIIHTNENLFEGDIGGTVELVRYLPPDRTQWAAGIYGSGTVLFNEAGGIYPMRAGDWFVGLYASESSGLFSNRFAFEHESSHLGDSLQGIIAPIIYNGENLNFADTFEPSEYLRFTAQLGVWISGLPEDKDLFGALETEIYTPGFYLGGTFTRGYVTAHFGWKDEAGGVLNKNLELGIQFKFKKEETRDLRVALVYYDGNSEFGQFYLNHDEHVGFGVYFDP